MKKTIQNLAALGIAFGAVTVMAGGPDMSTAPQADVSSPSILSGFYVGANVGYGAFASGSAVGQETAQANSTPGLHGVDSGVTFGLDIGYNINRYFAAQVSYLYLPRIVSSGTILGYAFSERYYSNMLALEGKGMYPLLNDKLVPFVTAGYGVIFESANGDFGSSSTNTWEGIFGAGLEYKVTPQFGVSAQYKVVTNFNNKYNTTNIGVGGLNYYF